MFASDSDYWIRILEGDENAFLLVYKKHYNELFRYGFILSKDKELTKDCIQEVFMELWNNSATITRSVHDIRAYLFTWLRRKINKAISLSIRQRTNEISAGQHENAEPPYEELLIAFQNSECEKERLRQGLKHLTKKQLQIIKMKFFENLSYEEIACKTSLTPRTVYNIVYEGLHRLRADKTLKV
jgi:RNA polymerase sigma-70 factor (ECF subfamily)